MNKITRVVLMTLVLACTVPAFFNPSGPTPPPTTWPPVNAQMN
ncbi:MAG TPA: hypothetical protein VFB79_10845 [Candidatus Angelobacter sp.]|nr:hypothetical protein [Candidatus Angelobacter sp.]